MSKKTTTTTTTGGIVAGSDATLEHGITSDARITGAAGNGKAPIDPFDLERLAIPQNYADEIGVKRALVTVSVRRPHRQEWVRVHRDSAYQTGLWLLDVEAERTTYVVDPVVAQALGAEVARMQVVTAITRGGEGDVFLWPLRHSDARNDWNESAAAAAAMATTRWVRLASNQRAKRYDIFTTEAPLDDPVWPDATLQELVRIAFKDRLIADIDHPVLLRLRGQA
jgi:hypothetical protein